jgi:hypothetical protein
MVRTTLWAQALERADDTLLKFLERRRKHVFDLVLLLLFLLLVTAAAVSVSHP